MPIAKRKPLSPKVVNLFSKGTRIRSTGGIMAGRLGVVHHPVKSRGMVCVEFDGHGVLFDARPEYLEVIN